MIVAVWIIAVCEVIRALQNLIQIAIVKHNAKSRDNAYSKFIRILKDSDRQFVRNMLEGYERQDRQSGKNQ